MHSFKRGFTLIELLVVIAIIGILASVVLVSLNSARNRGNDAAIKANLSGVRTQAELFYADNGNAYTGLCADPTIDSAVDAATGASSGTATCDSDADSWGASAPMHETGAGHWCVDYTGVAATTSSAATAAGCP